ncbi:DUF368 domain-containing protein [Borrelia sp. BU AG58]|uniref:undecaprenyl phosphate translocase family protein n=1 Tax=Borrelia sp. BU AG58 TaxID=2887345 RepID=UPI001E56CB0A|nr:DUF368 domain-containing protein [Borrelia sp. BU AG58]UER67902.1 DUF368 domain-containing protein [Borrelia sp. BU AG58]
MIDEKSSYAYSENLLSAYLKGLLIGVANVIPGVSGGTLALTLGIYYRVVYSCSALMKARGRGDVTFLTVLSLGVLTTAVVLSKLLKVYILDGKTGEACLSMLITGLITESVFSIRKEIKTKEMSDKGSKAVAYCLTLLGLFSVLSVLIIGNHGLSIDNKYQDRKSMEYFLLITSSGVISGSAMVIPGLSGSLLLLSLGTYKEIIHIVSSLSIIPCLIFGISAATGAGTTTLLIKKAIDKHLIKFLHLAIGLIAGSILQILSRMSKLNLEPSLPLLVASTILFGTGFYINKKLKETQDTSEVFYTEDRT